MDDKHSSPLGSFPSLLWALFFFVAVIVGVVSMVRGPQSASPVEAERGAARLQKREELEKSDAEKLTKPAWIDKSKQSVRVPIDLAKKVVAAELVAKKVAPSTVIFEAAPPVLKPSESSEPPAVRLPSAPQGADLLRFDAARPADAAGGGSNITQPPGQPSTIAQ